MMSQRLTRKFGLLGIALALSLSLGRGDSLAGSAAPSIIDYAGKDVGQGAAATNSTLDHPTGVALDSSGNLYIADRDDHILLKVTKSSGVIDTIAGNGFEGYAGDSGIATAARLSAPNGVARDSAGNVYFADTTNHRVRKINPSGVITTVAGNGACGALNDGGPATSASLCGPRGVAVDSAGNLYIADTYNQRIRKVNTSGSISTVAGNGLPGFSGDGGPATSASLRYPVGVAVGPSNSIYVADTDNHRVRKVDASGNISTVAGSGNPGYSGDGGPATDAGLYNPYGVAADSSGNVYVADTSNHRIRKIDTSGHITTVAGDGNPGYGGDGGPATSASLFYPSSVAIDGDGNLYVADSWNNRIRKVSASGDISTLAGNGRLRYSGDGGPATSADLNLPNDVAADSAGNVYIADYANNRVRKVNTGGTISTVAGNGAPGYEGDGGFATNARLYYPSGLATGTGGVLYIADAANSRVRKVDAAGIITTVAGDGTPGYSGDGGPATGAQLNLPWDVAVDRSGNLYIADYNNHRIRKVDASGNITTVAGTGTPGFSGDGGLATAAQICGPSGIALDGSGNLYVAEACNYRVRKVSVSGIIMTVAGNGAAGYSGDGGLATSAALNLPEGLAFDGMGNLYIGDSGNHRIRKVDTSGNITTIAGNGTAGYSGDGGPATSANLNRPGGVTIDPSGNLYLSDQGNQRVRKVVMASPAAVGGIAELPEAPKVAQDVAAPSPGSSPPWLAVAGGLATAAVVCGAGVWYARRRWRLR